MVTPAHATTSAVPSKGDPLLAQAYGLTPQQAAMHAPIPDAAFEYHIRRSLNDAAFNSLAYVPYCGCAPVCAKCENPKYMWTRKGGR